MPPAYMNIDFVKSAWNILTYFFYDVSVLPVSPVHVVLFLAGVLYVIVTLIRIMRRL